MRKITKFKKGAASFYIVAISTLILVIIAASFAAVIISEVTRTSNDDLSQSAYDSALAGVEDAKLTYYNYQKCRDGSIDGNTLIGANFKCSDLIAWIENGIVPNGQDECDVVANALARPIETNGDEKLGVLVQEGTSSSGDGSTNDMAQYYTCVKIAAQTQDVLGVLSNTDQEHSVRIRFADPDAYNNVAKVRLSWHSPTATDDGDRGFQYMEGQTKGSAGILGADSVKPAVVALTMVQTATSFSLGDFNTSSGAATDRGTLYFVPSPAQGSRLTSSTDNYIVAETSQSGGGWTNTIRSSETEGFAKSNNKGIKNVPYVVRCDTKNQDYACITESDIPAPVNGDRNHDTFIFSVSLPYGGPKTHFSLEFLDSEGNPLLLDGVQVSIDSTGRANDLFRRVETRLEPADAAYPYPIYGIQALNPESKPAIWKNFYSTCEFNFEATCEE